jgi:hypothetical protein
MVASNDRPTNDGTILGGSLVAAQAAMLEGFYACTLRDGTTITFGRLELSGSWVRLSEGGISVYGGMLQAAAVHSGVIEVRADDIRVITGRPKAIE